MQNILFIYMHRIRSEGCVIICFDEAMLGCFGLSLFGLFFFFVIGFAQHTDRELEMCNIFMLEIKIEKINWVGFLGIKRIKTKENYMESVRV